VYSEYRADNCLDRQLFLNSVLSELRGNELSSSTDPETSLVIERLLPSLNDWGRRVIGDAFFGTVELDERSKETGGNWGMLLRHRFGSHVIQSWLTLAAGTLDREVSRHSMGQTFYTAAEVCSLG
jgi:nucleolar protein 9